MTMAQACKRRYDIMRQTDRCVTCCRRNPDGKARCKRCRDEDAARARERSAERRMLAARVASLEAEVSELRLLLGK